MSNPPTSERWDIFCRVIDNFGDIGVCWRFARQLSAEHGIHVRLWLDDLSALKKIWPDACLDDEQHLAGVYVRLWPDPFPLMTTDDIPDVVIEAFACDIPDTYVVAMSQRPCPPRWFNLEYLSAEDWTQDYHTLNSMHPQFALNKTFFFPGFRQNTGGLLREKGLLSKRDQLQSHADRRAQALSQWGVHAHANSLIVSLFSYENSALHALLDSMKQGDRTVLCLIPDGKIRPAVERWLKIDTMHEGEVYRSGQLRLQRLPFLPQDSYDTLLFCCDINFVRGEDSFVRAQWAARPFIWHIYPQEDDVHLEKLDAFLDLYTKRLKDKEKQTIKSIFLAWNQNLGASHLWQEILDLLPIWNEHSHTWCQQLNSQADLVENLVHFSRKPLY
ncbi:elongation factor P maturation arginine rhamnosyltransferase EarP [Nitrincola alkalisediminis]|uniref:elongation factor P maturation arginine rhamnosyltransferase EarP n=1 Tax=Nitrincola alkalisediminis TaxID=1366656 RepID=UPI001874F5D8|nr:elongation factor P maturation arginine rhamnosyltransferase EarP [Nitrincola alkalisediminis]